MRKVGVAYGAHALKQSRSTNILTTNVDPILINRTLLIAGCSPLTSDGSPLNPGTPPN